MDVLRELLAARVSAGMPHAVVLTGDDAPTADLLTALAEATVDLVPADAGPDALHLAVAARAPLDLLVDTAGQGALERLAQLLGHVRAGGGYLCVLTDDAMAGEVAGWQRRLARLREELTSGATELPPRKAKRRRDLATLALTMRPRVMGRLLVAVPELDLLAKVHDADMDDLLRARGGPDRVVTAVAGASWSSRARVRTSRPSPLNELPTSYDAPPLSLREYHHAVCRPRQAAHTATFVTPESFRDNLQPRLQNPAFEDWTARFVRRPPVPDTLLPGSWFHLDTHVAGHFGHAVTEQLAHVWGWQEAKRRDPSLRALVFGPPSAPPGAPLPAWNAELLAGAGIDPDDVHVADAPVRVERLLAATAAYNIGRYVHPVMAQTWGAVGARLGGPRLDGVGSAPERVFLTRTGEKRRCRNRGEVEALFEASGFVVVSPEELPLAEQVRLVRGASVVAGFAGSAMFHTAFAARPQHVVVVTTETYPAHNEYAMAALLGHRLELVVCPPDVPRREPGRFTLESFHSDFVVDLAGAEGDFLTSVLADLESTR